MIGGTRPAVRVRGRASFFGCVCSDFGIVSAKISYYSSLLLQFIKKVFVNLFDFICCFDLNTDVMFMH